MAANKKGGHDRGQSGQIPDGMDMVCGRKSSSMHQGHPWEDRVAILTASFPENSWDILVQPPDPWGSHYRANVP